MFYPAKSYNTRNAIRHLCLALLCLTLFLTAREFPEVAFEARQKFAELKNIAKQDERDNRRMAILRDFFKECPMEMDWFLQDFAWEAWLKNENGHAEELKAIRKCATEINALPQAEQAIAALQAKNTPEDNPEWLRLYLSFAAKRRTARLKPFAEKAPVIAFVKRYPVSPSFYAYTEGQSDAQHERFFRPGTELCLLTIAPDGTVSEKTLIKDDKGMIRDPDVSFDAKRILFSWKKSDRQDDYHLYELTLETGAIRQITFGLGVADFEGIYLPGDQIVFSSSRCVQTVDCWWTEVSNLYTCDIHGHFLRRLGFDQVHTVYPKLLFDGSICYNRWDYNDRGQVYTQSLFRMNSDGTSQTELYGNNSWFPTNPCHVRPIPNSHKLLAVAMGHHTWQAGKLMLIDTQKGRQEAEGVEMLAPRAPAKVVHVDQYGQDGDLFRHPFPLSETEYITAYTPAAFNRRRRDFAFGLYTMDADGKRELLSWNPRLACNHPIVVAPRTEPVQRPSTVDYRKSEGSYYMQDVYAGPGLKGIPRGKAKSLRVVALDFRAAGIGNNSNGGPAGGAMSSTPVSINNGAWDVKTILGTTPILEDGSAFFKVPARTPVYFQILDEQGQTIQTMRSWSTLQPNEVFSCVGCHENKNESIQTEKSRSLAMQAGVQALQPYRNRPPEGFSYLKMVQPILNQHCIKCHSTTQTVPPITVKSSWCCTIDIDEAAIDGILPKHSFDTSIRRFTWYPKFNSDQWIQQEFNRVRTIDRTRVYWYNDRGGVQEPVSWRLVYRTAQDAPWQPVENIDEYGKAIDRFNEVHFKPVAAQAVRIEARMQERHSAGILEWEVYDQGKDKSENGLFLDLSSRPKLDRQAKRQWAVSYLNLTSSGHQSTAAHLNWLSPQSTPDMQPPYSAGAAKSKLIAMLRKGHKNVKLNEDEMGRLITWIDLVIPYCGDYREGNAWTDAEHSKYDYYEQKRQRFAAIERVHIEELVTKQTGQPWRQPGYTNLALNPFALEKPDSFPQATSNSECRGETCFKAANAIDGRTENRGHGPFFPSWGPDQRNDLWFKLDFGRTVTIDTIRLWVRADFPHDGAWSAAVVTFSDGSSMPISLRETADCQQFRFPEKTVSWLKIDRFEPAEPKAWRGITEIEAWGMNR